MTTLSPTFNITELIPQRPPMLLVDELLEADAQSCTTAYTVREDCVLCFNGRLSNVGIIEHMAQSASALAGYNARKSGVTEPPLGMIGEVRKFKCFDTPLRGERITTKIEMGLTVGEITNVTAETSVGDRTIANVVFKIVIKG